MKAACSRPSSRITCAMPFASATSAPTSTGSQPSAHWALEVRRGSTTYRRAPLRTALSTWWKKIGCVSRALEPQSTTTSVSSTSRYEEVPPPAPNTVARPTTLGACQVRLQLSMLLVPMTTRVNFWVMKFTSLVALEQLNSPNAFGLPAARTASKPAAARSSASSQVAGRSAPFSRTIGCVSRVSVFRISDHLPSKLEKDRKTGSGTYMMPFSARIGSGEPATSTEAGASPRKPLPFLCRDQVRKDRIPAGRHGRDRRTAAARVPRVARRSGPRGVGADAAATGRDAGRPRLLDRPPAPAAVLPPQRPPRGRADDPGLAGASRARRPGRAAGSPDERPGDRGQRAGRPLPRRALADAPFARRAHRRDDAGGADRAGRSPLGRARVGRDGVLGVADVLAPGGVVALLVDVEHREVGHEAVGCRAVPVLLSRLEEDAVARADLLDRSATALSPADALDHVDGLPVGMGVPGGAGAGCEVDAVHAQA